MNKAENNLLNFEFPLVERVRYLLRTEYLFQRFETASKTDDVGQHHFALATLFEIMDCSSRAELKLDLLQELERQRSLAEQKDAHLSEQLTLVIEKLHSVQQKFAQNLRDNEWLMTIKQRMGVSGGTSPFDLASYYAWQHLPFDERQHYLHQCSEPLMPTYHAACLVLSILRHNSICVECVAKEGNYQQQGLGKQVQLLRVAVPLNAKVQPEVSANRHLMNIRFVSSDFIHARGKQSGDTIHFHLDLCGFSAPQMDA